MEKFVLASKKMISTSKRHEKHPFAGQNTRQLDLPDLQQHFYPDLISSSDWCPRVIVGSCVVNISVYIFSSKI